MKRFFTPLRPFLACLLLLGAGLALAHAELVTMTPAKNSVLTTLPQSVTLTFSEPVEVGFSLFKVYKLEPIPASTSGGESGGETGGASPESEEEALRLNGLAGTLVTEVLTKRGDEAARADAGPATTGTAEEVSLNLKEGQGPGDYVVMWRVLSTDTHTTQGFYVFSYQPATP